MMEIKKTGVHGHDFWVKGVCLCGEGMRGLESAEKAVSSKGLGKCREGSVGQVEQQV